MDVFYWHLWIGPLLFCIHVLGLLAAAHAALTTRTSQGAIAWAVSLIFMPYLALVPYLIFGHTRFAGYVEARRLRNREFGKQAHILRESGAARAEVEAELGSGLDGILTLTALTGLPFTRGNEVRLLVNGAATFDAIFAAIATAKRYVIVQFFAVSDDGLGRRLQAVLLAKAQAQVPVYFLYDGIGSHALPRHYTDTLRRAGVQVMEFLVRRRRLINRYQLNFRNHRKIVVVDGEQAFVGGHNVGDEYLGLRPPLSPWRDTHISIRGAAVAEIQLAFLKDWYWASGKVPALHWQMHPAAGHQHCQVIPSGPADEQETCTLFFIQAINSARQRLWITTPYFVPDEAVFTALKLAVLRGVDVRVLLPSRPDHFLVYRATSLYALEAARAGVRVYHYQPGFLHQKVVLIDDLAASVGSANLDNRSFRLNFEITVLTVDRGFAADVTAMLEQDFRAARLVAPDADRSVPLASEVLMRVARLFAPVL